MGGSETGVPPPSIPSLTSQAPRALPSPRSRHVASGLSNMAPGLSDGLPDRGLVRR